MAKKVNFSQMGTHIVKWERWFIKLYETKNQVQPDTFFWVITQYPITFTKIMDLR